ncbi:hypothetical protein HDU97_007046, partial [Phlyctochytrium planicorne]
QLPNLLFPTDGTNATKMSCSQRSHDVWAFNDDDPLVDHVRTIEIIVKSGRINLDAKDAKGRNSPDIA